MIGCFCAASNITGVISDDVASTVLLHQYGALALWDYTIAAPCVSMNMNPDLQGDTAAYKDAIFFSGHKFIGGVQTPGKNLLHMSRYTLIKLSEHNVYHCISHA